MPIAWFFIGFFRAFKEHRCSAATMHLAELVLRIMEKLIGVKERTAKTWSLIYWLPPNIFLLFYIMIGYNILIPTSKEPIAYYHSLYNFRDLGNLLLSVLNNSVREFYEFFRPATDSSKFLSLLTMALAIIFIIIGLIKKCIKNPGVLELLVLTYSFIALYFQLRHKVSGTCFPYCPCIFIISSAECNLSSSEVKPRPTICYYLSRYCFCCSIQAVSANLLAKQGGNDSWTFRKDNQWKPFNT